MELSEKYIRRVEPKPLKMERNLQPEIEKLKSIEMSLRGRYVNKSEKQRILDAIDCLRSVIEVN